MRGVLAGLAVLTLAACSEADVANSDNPPGGYTLEVRADQDVQVFMVTAPDGRTTAARATDGVSGLMDLEEARAFSVLPAASEDAPPEVVALRLPGFDLSIAAEGNTNSADGARVNINAGGRQVHIEAQDDGGTETDRAHVRITGASESDARDFIADAEEISPETQAQMLAALGLN